MTESFVVVLRVGAAVASRMSVSRGSGRSSSRVSIACPDNGVARMFAGSVSSARRSATAIRSPSETPRRFGSSRKRSIGLVNVTSSDARVHAEVELGGLRIDSTLAVADGVGLATATSFADGVTEGTGFEGAGCTTAVCVSPASCSGVRNATTRSKRRPNNVEASGSGCGFGTLMGRTGTAATGASGVARANSTASSRISLSESL